VLSAAINGYIYDEIEYHHGNLKQEKSVWLIKWQEELASFGAATSNLWIENQFAWGLHLVNNSPDYLGKLALKHGPNRCTKIAMFILNDRCHGYPIDNKDTDDLPPGPVQKDWMTKGYFSKAKMNKIIGGKDHPW
jgi:hypothetical protein